MFAVRPGTKRFYPLRVSQKDVAQENHINLLLLWNGEKAHYILIKNLAGLLRKQLTTHQQFVCYHCLRCCRHQHVLDAHKLRCKANRRQYERYPVKGDEEKQEDRCKFKNAEYEVEQPYYIVADFETVIEPIEGPVPSPNVSNKCLFFILYPMSFPYFTLQLCFFI